MMLLGAGFGSGWRDAGRMVGVGTALVGYAAGAAIPASTAGRR